MNIRKRVPFTSAAIFALTVTTCFAANAQNRLNDRFAWTWPFEIDTWQKTATP